VRPIAKVVACDKVTLASRAEAVIMSWNGQRYGRFIDVFQKPFGPVDGILPMVLPLLEHRMEAADLW
jgi:hypothetical protein